MRPDRPSILTTQFTFTSATFISTFLLGPHSLYVNPSDFDLLATLSYVVHVFRSSHPLLSLTSLRSPNHTTPCCQTPLAEIPVCDVVRSWQARVGPIVTANTSYLSHYI